MSLVDELSALADKTLAEIASATSSSELEAVRVAVVGKSGTLTAYLRSMGNVPKEERAEVGKSVNATRVRVEQALEEAKSRLAAAELASSIEDAAVDVTLPGRAQQIGSRHLINGMIDELCEIFLGLGYSVVEGPEVETDYYNFEALNAPPDHPSRSMPVSYTHLTLPTN